MGKTVLGNLPLVTTWFLLHTRQWARQWVKKIGKSVGKSMGKTMGRRAVATIDLLWLLLCTVCVHISVAGAAVDAHVL